MSAHVLLNLLNSNQRNSESLSSNDISHLIQEILGAYQVMTHLI